MAETSRQPRPPRDDDAERDASRSPAQQPGRANEPGTSNGTNGDAAHQSEKRASEDDWDGEWDQDDNEDDDLVLEDDPEEMATWSGHASVKGNSEIVRMLLLNFNAIGMTFTWGVEMTYCTPYLLSLGLSKSQTSMVWIAGPLSGLVVQPIVGVLSDQFRSKWGRRRPFIFVCSCIVSCGLATLGFTKEIVGLFIGDSDVSRVLTIVLAVIALYATDFAINAVMSCSRSLVVDTLPIQKQQAGAAWQSRMASVGHVMGYGAGAIDLVKIFGPTMGDTQFKKLTLVAAAGILISSCVTCWAVTERVLLVKLETKGSDGRRFKVFWQIWSTLLTLPPRMQAICWAVFWSWIGWFPFLIYSSTWVGETYFRYDAPAEAKDSKDALGDMGRVGSAALTVYSIVTFTGAWVLPLLVRSPENEEADTGIRLPESITRFLERFEKLKPDLLTVWITGHLMFAAAMSLAPFAASFRFATLLVAVCGIPWTIAMWAPTAFLGIEVNKLTGASEDGAGPSYRRLSAGNSVEMMAVSPRRVEDGTGEDDSGGASSTGELSGVYFGILNIYTTLPQFVGTFISTIIFHILEPGKSPELATEADPSEHHPTDGPNAIAICLFIGAVSAVGAAYATTRLKKLA